MPKFTIRNLTITPLELVQVDRYKGEKVSTGNVLTNVTGKITGFLNATEFSAHEVRAADGKPTSTEKPNVKIDAFKGKETGFDAPQLKKEVFRIILKADGKRFEADVPSPSSKSTVMKKLDGGSHDFTVVYTEESGVLAVYSSAKLNAWMKELHDEWPLSVLSIPGTHNSPTCHTALPSVRCQSVDVPKQLHNGVRFLDIRVSANPDDDQLTLVHSVFPVSLTGNKYFGDMCNDIYKFLDDNPTETIIMSIKREGTGKGTDGQLGKYLKASYVDKKRSRWWTEPKMPTLGGARGRIVIVRRFGLDDSMRKACWDGRGWGIDANGWPDNCEDGKVGGANIRVQDFYEITESQNIEKKLDFSRRHLERAAESRFLITGMEGHKAGAPHPPMFVNFLSASNFFNATCWPERIAAKVNPSIIEYLCQIHGDECKGPKKLKVGCGGAGVVVTDWVGANDDWDLIRCIVGMNARLQLKQ